MRLPILPVLLIIVVGALIDLYIYRRIPREAVVARTRLRWHSVQSASGMFFAVMLAAALCLPRKSGTDAMLISVMWLLFTYFSVYAGKLVFIITDFIGGLPKAFRKPRIKALTYAGATLGIIVFALMWWGALINRFRTDIREVDIEIPDLPTAFDGYRIVQVSDMHVGTYGADTTFLHKLVSEVNALHPDLIVFTGDIVNRHTAELLPHTTTLSGLKAPDGVISILGNHDYGDYATWTNEAEKLRDRELLYSLQKDMGWKLLRNETEWLKRGNDSLAIIGVENIGEPPFSVYGDLKASYSGDLDDSNAKILLSHNPMHWANDIAGNEACNIALTLSGHTHAMQIELFGISPAAWRYETWGGLYTDSLGHNLYVNIGTGTVGAPMRIGATPEITLFTLKGRNHTTSEATQQ